MSKKHSNPNSQNMQLSLFEEPTFDGRIRRMDVDGVTYFSILDVFQYYGKSSNPTMAWKIVIKRLDSQGFDSSKEILELQFPGERQRKTPVATFKCFLRIAQVTDFKEWEHLRMWMADTAHEKIQEIAYLKSGKDERWIEARVTGKATRKEFIRLLCELIRNPNIGAFTNDVYVGVFGMTAKQIREKLGLKQSQEPRDHFSTVALFYVGIAEETCTIELEPLQDEDIVTEEMARRIVQIVANEIGLQAQSWAKSRDLLTGRRLLKG